MKDWLLDRLAHLAFRHLPVNIAKESEQKRYSKLALVHLWGIERCAMRHFDDPRCWVEEEMNRDYPVTEDEALHQILKATADKYEGTNWREVFRRG